MKYLELIFSNVASLPYSQQPKHVLGKKNAVQK